jgi:4-amino-4-deoxy-L-arabinose transferase-like glycosyltransferase
MMEALHRSPAHVSAQAAAPLPRWALVCLLLAFIVPGLFGHELWPQDAAGFGRMWSMAQGTAIDWLLPNVAGTPTPQAGPLPSWIGAIFIVLLGRYIGDTNAAAASNLIWYPLIVLALWAAVYRLARRDEAQPVAAAFGGEASRHDYARLLADISVLLTIGTLGVIWRLHQTRADSASMACVAVAMLATSLIEWQLEFAALLAGCAVGCFALTQGPLPAAGLLLGCLCVFWRARATPSISAGRLFAASGLLLLVALVLAASWPLAAFHWYPKEAEQFFASLSLSIPFGWPSLEDAAWLAHDGSWFFWPLWPLALWAVYAWRSSLLDAHVERPLLLLIGLGLAMFFSAPLDELAAVGILPPLVVLAAYGATTLRRALDNVIDWLAMALFSLLLVMLWAYFLAMELGVPKAMAASIARLTPGYTDHVHVAALVLAAVASVAWVQLIAWRVLRRPPVLWRGPLLAASGVTVIWIAANLLYLPAVDYVFSYRKFAVELATQLRARGLGQGCVQAHRIPLPERAIIAYYGKIRFDRDGSSESCPLALHHDSKRSTLDNDPPPGVRGMWTPSWEGRRRARPDERWRIWVRNP